MATDVQIASLALTRIGHEGITSFSASGNKASRWFTANYDFLRESLTREHGWRFAIKRDVLAMDTIIDITNLGQSNPIEVTAAGHGKSNGDVVFIAGVIGMTEVNNRTFTVANKTTDTFELSGTDGTGYTAYSSGGKLYGFVATEYSYRFALPSDCLRLLRINDGEEDDYRVEQGYILTNEGTCSIEYIFDQETESTFDSQFVDLFAARLSAEICFYMTSSQLLTEQAWKVYNEKASIARTMDSRQGYPRGIEADIWLNARA